MCTLSRIKPKLCIAKRDITVYKKVLIWSYENVILSFYYSIQYKIDIKYNTALDPFIKIENGYKSGSGFYSYTTPKDCNVECIIPKGSLYYLAADEFSERYVYTSDTIIIKRIL